MSQRRDFTFAFPDLHYVKVTTPASEQYFFESAQQAPLALPTSEVAGLGNVHGMDSLHVSRIPPGKLLQCSALPKSVKRSSHS